MKPFARSVLLALGFALGAIGVAGCALRSPVANADDAGCHRGALDCPIALAPATPSARSPARYEGLLTPEQPRVSLSFVAPQGAVLHWSYAGPNVRMTLRYPGGDVDGPGLPDLIPLNTSGEHVLTISSNLMAEDIYGSFRIRVWLDPAGE
ncbi:MAG TPA: hypothetical protein VMU33_19080 [Burkholderiaceae bacterium]|nr:hypothetical protein [Burkholderiaceae bacterium]